MRVSVSGGTHMKLICWGPRWWWVSVSYSVWPRSLRCCPRYAEVWPGWDLNKETLDCRWVFTQCKQGQHRWSRWFVIQHRSTSSIWWLRRFIVNWFVLKITSSGSVQPIAWPQVLPFATFSRTISTTSHSTLHVLGSSVINPPRVSSTDTHIIWVR